MVDLRIPISSLYVGKYAVKLRRLVPPTPFLEYFFLVEHELQIERSARAGVKTVRQETR